MLISFGGGRRDARRSKLIVRLGELGRVVRVISVVEAVLPDVERLRVLLQLLHGTVQRCERGCCSTGITYRRAYRLASHGDPATAAGRSPGRGVAASSGWSSRSDQVWVYAVVTRRPMPKSRVSQTTVFGAQRPMLRTLHD